MAKVGRRERERERGNVGEQKRQGEANGSKQERELVERDGRRVRERERERGGWRERELNSHLSSFVSPVGSQQSFELILPRAPELASVIKDYGYWLREFAQFAVATADYQATEEGGMSFKVQREMERERERERD